MVGVLLLQSVVVLEMGLAGGSETTKKKQGEE
jgi:hypothetical protein